MTIYYFEDEVKRICEFLKADEKIVTEWLQRNENTNKYITFEAITSLGCDWVQVIYGKNLGSTTEVICQVSCLGTRFQEESQPKCECRDDTVCSKFPTCQTSQPKDVRLR